MNTESPQVNGASSIDGDEVPTYSEAFPPLATLGNGDGAQTVPNNWINPKVQRLRSTVVTQLFHIPTEERAFKHTDNFGQSHQDQNKACLDIMKVTDTQIEMSTRKDGSLTLLITGTQENVLKARRNIVSKLQTQAHVALDIPKDHHRVILGKGGARLQKLEMDTATKINIPRSEENKNSITITGTQEGISKARHEIQLISDEQAKLAMEKLSIEKIYHPWISGPKNATANRIIQETGVRIHIPPPTVDKNEIVVAGEKEGVMKAVKQINEIYHKKKRTCTTIAIEVNQSQHKYIIGPRGSTLQDILAETDVSVEVPPSDSNSMTVTLRGEPNKLGQALTVTYAKANSVVIREMPVESWLHKFIIGKRGANINKISQQVGGKVNIEFQSEDGKIIVEGPPETVEQAYSILEQQAVELRNTKSFLEVKIDPKYHKNIIGKGGQNINKIRNQFNVQIRIPSDTEGSSIIRVEGDPNGVQEAKKLLLEMNQKMENERSKDIVIEQRFHKNIIGQGGENIKQIREKFPEVNVSFPDASAKSDIVNIRGAKNMVDKCHKYLKQLADDLMAKNYSIQVPIFKEYHKNIIGKGGSNIRKIREETNTQIELPTENSDNEVIKIIGRREDCEKARKMIRKIESEMTNIVEVNITVSQKLHNSMIGTKGKFVRLIMQECNGVHIHFPQEGSGSDQVTIRGNKEDVEKARKELLDLAQKRELMSYTSEVKCKPEFHKFLIGRAGSAIRKVRDDTDCRIIFPSAQDTDKDVISIIGQEVNVKKAVTILQNHIKELENVIEISVEVETKHHKHFVARRATVLRDLADEYGGVIVSFPKQGQDSTTVTIKGPKDCAEGAKKRILEIVDDLDNQVTIECEIPEQYHRTVIGQKGSKVQKVTSEFGVQIKFPDHNNTNGRQKRQVKKEEVIYFPSIHQDQVSPGPKAAEQITNGESEDIVEEPENKKDIILITGHKEKCQKAKEALLALVPQTEEVVIPYKFHRFIIGKKGSEVRAMMEEHDVNIAIPSADENSDIVVVTGVADNLEGARAALMEKVKELEKEEEERALKNFSLTVEIPHEFHPKIIGRRGAIVSEIRKQYDVNIQVPARNDEEVENKNIITITGYEGNANQAKAYIMKIVSDLESHVSQDIHIDRRVHPRLIGQKGRSIRKIMDDYGVDIRFPQDQDIVTVTGLQDKVEECIEHILNLEEEYMQDIAEREESRQYMRSSGQGGQGGRNERQAPFVVRNAPWQDGSVDTNSMDDFPSLGGGRQNQQYGQSVWGKK